ncbi:MAG TPA: protein phosphatase 2C domain-containing protein [Labilithrix sp.]|nr:protein phosphatase 2C domain-containing protein [Labilithrix sp.]
MASGLFRFFRRLGSAAPLPEARAARRVPVRVTVMDEDDEPALGGGASVRSVRCEAAAEGEPPAAGRALFAVRAAGRTDAGKRRMANEDALLVLRQQAVYVVADGMGGHAGGAVASQLAVEAIATAFTRGIESPCPLADVPPLAAELVHSLAAANESIRRAAAGDLRLSDMGTTVVAARFCPERGRLYVGHVGDSRCYRLREGALERLTSDHTMAELGVTGRASIQLSRAVGSKGVVEADVAVLEPRAGDVYLLCTDGLTKMISDEEIRAVLVAEVDAESAASMLVARANAEGGRDNVTVLVIHVETPVAEGGVLVA